MSSNDSAAANPASLVPARATTLGEVDPKWAWARYEPSAARPWGTPLAAHLYRRAGFGATWQELQTALTRGPHATIDELLRQPESYPGFANEHDAHETAAARSGDTATFVAWWLSRLQQSPWPLLEKLTLFWHSYFAIRSASVADPKLMQTHVRLLRTQSLGEFPNLILALADDPAMYAGLGGQQNRKGQPNLQFARPWIEAYTLGPDAVTAEAVLNLARSWTGWFLYGGKLRLIEREQDLESKTLLGRAGNFGRNEAVRLLAEDPATARNLARRLFRAFVSESASPSDPLLAPLADLIARPASLREILEFTFRSNLFFSAHAFSQCVKSPVELAVGLLRSLDRRVPSAALAAALAPLGQRLDAPPTVHGWSGGVAWLNTLTMAGRLQLCDSLLRGSGSFGGGLDPLKVATANGVTTPDGQARFLVDLLLAGQIPEPAVQQLKGMAVASANPAGTAIEAIIAQPEFQLN